MKGGDGEGAPGSLFAVFKGKGKGKKKKGGLT